MTSWGTLVSMYPWAIVGMFATASNRGRVVRWLGELGNKGATKESEAAAIASLVGGAGTAGTAIAAAKARFRGLPLSYLSVEDMQSNKPSPELFGKTEIQELGEAECFVSHSWSDPGEPKYAALQEWKEPFIEKEVDPVLWLDKACIDQGDIDANLASLPIFLSGCKSMMCLIGRTYTSRLW